MDSMATRIYAAAKDAFGVPEVYKAWPMISNSYETLLWQRFNWQYGPLTVEQLAVVEDHVKECLAKAKDAPNTYASFRFHMNASITDSALATRLQSLRVAAKSLELPELQGMPFDEW